MADEPHVVRGISWREVFPFTHIFRAFRIAIHPSKLLLALLALLTLYTGGRILDRIWMNKHRAVPGEIEAYEGRGDLREIREARRENAAHAYARQLQTIAVKGGDFAKLAEYETALAVAREGKHTSHVEYRIRADRDAQVAEADRLYEQADKSNADAAEAARRAREDRKRAAYDTASDRHEDVEAIRGEGLFAAFFKYQTQRINRITEAVLDWNWLGVNGVFYNTFAFFTVAPSWALRHHWLYFLLFGILFLVVWSLFGGAIARIAAVHVADEGRKLSVRQGLSFAVSKFLSFISAPMIPLLIVAILGAVLAGVSGLAHLLYLDIVIAALWFLALAAGFVMALVLVGTAGGFNLMYPTIAVEGSDSFDAISRSFSYVYAKPWRMLFYSALAIAYGALTYLFVRFFIWLVLSLTNFFAGLFVYRRAAGGENVWTTMFPPPAGGPLGGDLPYNVSYASLGWYGDIAAFLLAFWNYLLIALLGAFAISFYFSVNTVIYYLMRREVDATEMDDVYLEQPEEDFAETPTTTTSPATPAAPAGTSSPSAATPTTIAPGSTVTMTAGDAGAKTYVAPPADQKPDAPAGT